MDFKFTNALYFLLIFLKEFKSLYVHDTTNIWYFKFDIL